MKIGRPVFNKVKAATGFLRERLPDGGSQIESGLGTDPKPPTHPLTLLRIAYGI